MKQLILSTIVVPMDVKKLGIQLKKARLDSGLSQEEVGTKLGLTWEMVSRYENGRTSPMKHIQTLADLYQKPVSFFVNNDTSEYDSFTLDDLVSRLKEEGMEYRKANPFVVKLIKKISGRGIDVDLSKTVEYTEAPASLIEKYDDLFSLKIKNIENKTSVPNNAFGFFTLKTDQIDETGHEMYALTYDGMQYMLEEIDKEEGAILAVLVGINQIF